MANDVAARVSALVEPLIEARGAELYDVVLGGATLQLLVAGGVDLDQLAALTREISAALDAEDPMPDRYTLEVSTPGLERTLRTPRHFTGAIGEKIKVKTVAGTNPSGRGSGQPERRVDGTLVAADDAGFVVDTGTEERRLSYDDVERVRTVFEWGAAGPSGRGSGQAKKPVSPSKRGSK